MRFGDEYREHQQRTKASRTGIVCYWMRRTPGKIATRVDVRLTPAQCAHFQIWAPMALGKDRAERIEAWSQKREARAP